MAGQKYVSEKYRPRFVKLKNKLNGETIEGVLVNEEDIDGGKYFVLRFLIGNVNKFNKEAFSLVGNTLR